MVRIVHPASCLTRLVAPVLGVILSAGAAFAQGDGPRVYQNVPDGTHVLSLYGIFDRGNQLPDPASVVTRGTIDINLAVVLYMHPIAIAGRSGGVFAVLPGGGVSGVAEYGPGLRLSGSSSGIADAAVGIVHNLVGSPALAPRDYAAFEPGFSLGVLGKVFAPIGEYSSSKVVNLGANRWAYQLGAPICYYMGRTYLDPRLTTIELLPTVTFYSANDAPFAADRREQKAMFRLETHVTRNVARALWVSLDGMYIAGGETTTDGVAADDRQEAIQLGGTVNVTLSRSLSVKVSYGGIVGRNDGGPDGHMTRVIGTWVF